MSTLKPNNGDCTFAGDAEPSEDDEYYMHCMAEILDAFRNAVPPAHPTRLSEHLYIGNQDNADDVQLLSALDITHVLNMAGTRTFDLTRSPYKPESGIRSFLMIPAEDFEEFDILPYMLEAIAFLSRAETSSGCAFVHCNYGVNRSGVVAAAYLMIAEHKPLLQVVNEMKAKRSKILTNVGFRRQLVRFARCRGLLDRVERPSSRRSPRLEPGGETTPRGATPSKDAKDEAKEESNGDAESTETNETVKETTSGGKNGETQPINGYHVPPPALAVSLDLERNGVVPSASLRPPRPTSSRRERLLRDIDSTIEALTVHDDADVNPTYYTSSYRPRDVIDRVPSPSPHLHEPPRATTYLPALISYTADSMTSGSVTSSSPQFDVLDHLHSSDSEEDYPASSFTGDRSASFYGYAQPSSNAILDEYLQYKSASAIQMPVATFSVQVPAGRETFVSAVKPRSRYSRSSSAIHDYDEADISSFLAERDARLSGLSPRGSQALDQSTVSRLISRRSGPAPSLDVILGLPRSYSAGKALMSLGAGYKPSPEVRLFPAPAYLGRWYPGSISSAYDRRYSPVSHSASYGMGMTSYESGSDFSGELIGSVGRTIATRVTPAPGYGLRSAYARSHSTSRYM